MQIAAKRVKAKKKLRKLNPESSHKGRSVKLTPVWAWILRQQRDMYMFRWRKHPETKKPIKDRQTNKQINRGNQPTSMPIAISAIMVLMAWWFAMAVPMVLRVSAYFAASSYIQTLSP